VPNPCTLNPPYRPRFQWEDSSGSFDCSQSNNCGPTGTTQQADYYLDRHFGIEDTRVMAAARCVPTTAWEQAQMFGHRTGIPAAVVNITDISQLDKLVNKYRPVGIGVLMSRFTARTRGHPFLGWHRITLLRHARRTRDGVSRRGFVYTDPNFSPPGGIRPDPYKGHRWVSRRELEYAFVLNSPAYAIVPERAKR
jgi:hypothetical protein